MLTEVPFKKFAESIKSAKIKKNNERDNDPPWNDCLALLTISLTG